VVVKYEGDFNMKTRNLKLVIAGLLLVCAMAVCGCGSATYDFDIKSSPDFRKVNLYDSISTVKSTEFTTTPTELSLGEAKVLKYNGLTIDGFDANVLYQFSPEDNSLQIGVIYYQVEESNMDEVYTSLVKKCDSLYGTNYIHADGNSRTWKSGDKYIVVNKGKSGNNYQVYYSVNTPESYE